MNCRYIILRYFSMPVCHPSLFTPSVQRSSGHREPILKRDMIGPSDLLVIFKSLQAFYSGMHDEIFSFEFFITFMKCLKNFKTFLLKFYVTGIITD